MLQICILAAQGAACAVLELPSRYVRHHGGVGLALLVLLGAASFIVVILANRRDAARTVGSLTRLVGGPSVRGTPQECTDDHLDLVLGRAALWVLGSSACALLTVGVITRSVGAGLLVGIVVGLVGAISDLRNRRLGGRGVRLADLSPAGAFAAAYPVSLVVAPWYTHAYGYGVTPVGVALLVVLVLGVAGCSYAVLAMPGGDKTDIPARSVAQVRAARRAALVLTVVSVAGVLVRGIGLLLMPEALAFWLVSRALLRDLGLPTRGGRAVVARVAKVTGITVLLYGLLLVGLVAAAGPLFLGGSPFDILDQSGPDAPANLFDASPFQHGHSNTVEGQTADVMQRRYPHLRFVRANRPSTGPKVISVNPIDAYTWGAVARARSGRCYALVWVLDRREPQYGGSRYGFVPRSSPCEASFATPATIRGDEW